MPISDEVERNKAVLRRLPGLLAHPDPDLIGLLFTPDFRLHDAKYPTGRAAMPAPPACSNKCRR
ncbi:MAG TPA: hypothetical protein VMU22_15220 [Rhizomicrobium sp.]|nr:hypothetical protein [Rhizomicrobium sp.]